MTVFRTTPVESEHTLIRLKQSGPDVLVIAEKKLPNGTKVVAKFLRVASDGIIYRLKLPDKNTADILGLTVTDDLYIVVR